MDPEQGPVRERHVRAYVRVQGTWLIQRLWWVPTFYFNVPGFDQAVFESGPVSDAMPPDGAARAKDEALGRIFPPFHYPHPVTGAAGKTPASEP